MNKVAIVVQRSHEDIVGGSETLAWHYAQILRNDYEVDLLTTTAIDTSEWANTLPAGTETRDGVRIVRFPGATFFERMRVKLGWGGLPDSDGAQ